MSDPYQLPPPQMVVLGHPLITIGGKPFVRPCATIAPETLNENGIVQTLAERYADLTKPLPLMGTAVLGTKADGQIDLIARLRGLAPWMEPAIAAIERDLRLQLWTGRPWLAWRPLCLTGPPGTGKSHLAKLVGKLAGTGAMTLDLGGVSDARTLEGTARGWMQAQPCWPAIAMEQAGTANPVLLLEEIDKAGGSARNGSPHGVLLTMIERETARTYYDKCLLAEVDLSHICWVATCNDANLLPPMLRSRLDIVQIDGPGAEHFDAVVTALLAGIADEWGIAREMLPEMPTRAVAVLREAFGRTRSVRAMRRHLERIMEALISSHVRAVH